MNQKLYFVQPFTQLHIVATKAKMKIVLNIPK